MLFQRLVADGFRSFQTLPLSKSRSLMAYEPPTCSKYCREGAAVMRVEVPSPVVVLNVGPPQVCNMVKLLNTWKRGVTRYCSLGSTKDTEPKLLKLAPAFKP